VTVGVTVAEEIKKVEPTQQAPAQGKPEKKVEPTQQAPAQGEPEKKVAEGLDAYTADQLKALYKRSPQMFEDAGIVQKKEVKEPEKKVEEIKPASQSAAPAMYGETVIKFADDVPVNKEVVARYLAHAKEIGLSPEQVQKEVDFQVLQYREAIKAQPKPKTDEEIRVEADTANVAKLKADKEFGGQNYDANMEVARRAAVKFGDPELLERLKTSDPVLVRHFWKLGKAEAEDTTRGAPNRSGNETDDAERAQKDHLRQRFKNTPQMFPDGEAGNQ
jgi:hypothetical protein